MQRETDDAPDRLARGIAATLRTSLAWLPNALLAAGSLLLAVDATVKGPLFWLGVSLSGAGILSAIVATPKVGAILERARRMQDRASERTDSLTNIMDLSLRSLLTDMEIDLSKARASVYRSRADKFILVARVSQSQTLKRVGRLEYPSGEGLIGKTWDHGSAVATDLPEGRTAWEDHCVQEYGMARSAVQELKMQARSILGKRIESTGPAREPVGLLVIESLAARGVNGATQDSLTSLQSWPLVSAVLHEVVRCLDEQDSVAKDSA